MRGRIDEHSGLFHTFNVEDRIRADHPLRDAKRQTDRILASLSGEFGTKIVTHAKYVVFQLAEGAVPRALFAAILNRIGRLQRAVNSG